MPYQYQFIEPEIAMVYRGVKVYHCYIYQDIDHGPEPKVFSWNIYGDGGDMDDGSSFNVQDLPTYDEALAPLDVIKNFIDTQLATNDEPPWKEWQG